MNRRNILISLFVVLASFFVVAIAKPTETHAQYLDPQLQRMRDDIDYFLGQLDVSAYLVWQYSGDRWNALGNDQYSFFRGSPVCDLLEQANVAYPGRIGVNMWNISTRAGEAEGHFRYLHDECGVSIIRIFGDLDYPGGNFGAVAALQQTLNAAAAAQVQLIIALGNYNGDMGSPHMPSNIVSYPTPWYSSGYLTSYLGWVTTVSGAVGGHTALYGFELANEPHCSGLPDCVGPYVSWARAVSAAIRRASPNRGVNVGIGQMASFNATRGDSPGVGTPSDYERSNSVPNITMASGHYYSTCSRANNILAAQIARRIGRPFYVGEAGIAIEISTDTSCNNVGPGRPIGPITPPNPDDPGLIDYPPPPPGPIPEACRYDNGTTNNEEFYSLRPYPRCPWNTSRETRYYQCANDLIATETLQVGYPNPQVDGVEMVPGSCVREGNDPTTTLDDTIRCDYTVAREIEVAVNMATTQLPIAGLSQNPTNPNPIGADGRQNDRITSAHASYAQKMNEYVNWYLQGVFGRAEDPLPDIPGQERNIVNFSGPLKKLLPWAGVTESRISTINTVGDGGRQPQGNPTGQHNQIVGCTVDALGIGDFPVPCYDTVDFQEFTQMFIDRVPTMFDHLSPAQRALSYVLLLEQLPFDQIRGAIFDQIENLVPANIFCDFAQDNTGGIVGAGVDIACNAVGAGVGTIFDVLDALSGVAQNVVADIVFGSIRATINLTDDVQQLENISRILIPIIVGYLEDAGVIPFDPDVEVHRVSEWTSHIPPIYEGGNFNEYWRNYLNWRGEFCSPVLIGFYLCFDERGILGQNNFWADIFPNMPLTGPANPDESVVTTEDRIGLARGEIAFTQPPSDVTIQPQDIEFIPNQGLDGAFSNLYFANMQAIDQLGELLQTTFTPSGADRLGEVRPQGIYDTNRCEVLESHTNPGDTVYGNTPAAGDEIGIEGTIQYQGTFSCTFRNDAVDTICYDAFLERAGCRDLVTGEITCSGARLAVVQAQARDYCPVRCPVNVATALSVYTNTPFAGDVWSRLVNGPMSVFRRMYPRVGTDTPVTQIEDNPAQSTAVYSSNTGGASVLAGDPGRNRPGSQAQVFFPHLGSVYDYFLEGIQTALRPYGIGNTTTPGTTPPIGGDNSPVDPSQCRDASLVGIGGWPPAIQAAFDSVSQQYGIPSCVLMSIASAEGSRMRLLSGSDATFVTTQRGDAAYQARSVTYPNFTATNMYDFLHCSPNYANAAGPMGITLSVWNRHRQGGEYICNARDAIAVAARFLINERLPIYGPVDWSNPRTYCAAGQTYYGSCRLDAPTCGNLGQNYCDHVLYQCDRAGAITTTATCADFFPTQPR